jgi:Amt family ammonium transporter
MLINPYTLRSTIRRLLIPFAATLLILTNCSGWCKAGETHEATDKVAAALLAGEVAQTNLDYGWVLTAAAMVFLMQAGFMCLESGMARAKSSINVAVKNLTDFVLSVSAFWLFGFGLMFGTSYGGLIGTSDFFV